MKLTAKGRAKIPTREFAGPDRSYPIENRSHAANAKARAKQQLNAGRLTKQQYAHIVEKANEVLK